MYPSTRHLVKPGTQPGLKELDPSSTGHHLSHSVADNDMADCLKRLTRLQYLLFADGEQSLLIVLQGLDAAGKDGTIRHVFTGMNPQGTRVAAFKQPTPREAAHDFLWRAHKVVPTKGEVVIFNRSHYEDVLVARVHQLVPEHLWRSRYVMINDFEAMLQTAGTRILKFFLHISPDEQLDRFRKRLEDPRRQWKISESDYTEREYWDDYLDAYEEALARTSTEQAPWYVIPSDHKWYRNFAVAEIIGATLENMNLHTPPVHVDLDDIQRRFHMQEQGADRGPAK
jgi:PPK2 family polyphosphate:nucleotide phosphotransferase